MTKAQYIAILEIAEFGERVAPQFLNVRPQTIAAIAKRGWVEIRNGRAFVTAKGWEAAA